MRAFCCTNFFAPSASAMVTTAGSASGMAATAREMQVRSMSNGCSFLRIPIPKPTGAYDQNSDGKFPAEHREPLLKGRFHFHFHLQQGGNAS